MRALLDDSIESAFESLTGLWDIASSHVVKSLMISTGVLKISAFASDPARRERDE